MSDAHLGLKHTQPHALEPLLQPVSLYHRHAQGHLDWRAGVQSWEVLGAASLYALLALSTPSTITMTVCRWFSIAGCDEGMHLKHVKYFNLGARVAEVIEDKVSGTKKQLAATVFMSLPGILSMLARFKEEDLRRNCSPKAISSNSGQALANTGDSL